MPHSEAQAWWADVQHVRESIERRRAGAADSPASVDASDERRFVRPAADSLPVIDDLDWTSSIAGRSRERSGGRFDPAARRDGSDAAPYGEDDRDGYAPFEYTGGPFDATAEPLDFDAERAGLEHARRRRRSSAERSASRRDESIGARSTTAPAAAAALLPPPARRTVQITGRTVAAPSLPRLVEVERRRPARRPAERVGPRPDRVALWAVLLGFFLILVAATSSNAATHRAHGADAAAVVLHAPAR